MGHVEAGVVLLRQFHSHAGTLIASLLTTDLRMMDHLGIVTILLLGLSHIAIDDGRVLTMGHDGQL